MTNKLSLPTRIIASFCALALAMVLVLPIWRIELSAPQYPEGLVLKIYADRLGGDITIVNGLNHYIGMHTLHEKDFVEFTVLPYIIGAFVLFGILSVIINRKWFFLVWVGFFILFAATAMIDFYRWEYNYGHNLDPTAPIQVPGMTYQPPLIGYKQLLNFGAYSIPGIGGWVFIAVGVILFVTAFFVVKKRKRDFHRPDAILYVLVGCSTILLSSCATNPEPIRYGQDACDFCKMTFTDKRFGAEVLTKKGKIFKFDDTHCLNSFLKSSSIDKNNIASIWMLDFPGTGKFTEASRCYYLKSDEFHSPMGGNIAAFSNPDTMEAAKKNLQATTLNWNEVSK